MPPAAEPAATSPSPGAEPQRWPFHGPSDGFALANVDWDRVRAWLDAVIALRDGRAEYLRARGLDPALHLPGHMWAAGFVDTNLRKLARQDRRTVEHLRCLTYNFTGFDLLTMAPHRDDEDLAEVPADVDTIVRAAAPRAAEVAASFVHTTRDLPRERLVATPRLFAESGCDVGGRLVNCDTWATQQRLDALHGSGVLDLLARRVRERGFARVVEIGAGYGNLAHALHTTLGAVDYTIVDLPESLAWSTVWLTTTLPSLPAVLAQPGQPPRARGPGITFVGNHLLPELLPRLGEVDLVVNMLSLSEMSPAQVVHYGRAARTLIGTGGVFFEQNYVVPGVQTDLVALLRRELPHGASLDETSPPHRGRGEARMWANRYFGELWDRGGVRPLHTRADPGAGGPTSARTGTTSFATPSTSPAPAPTA